MVAKNRRPDGAFWQQKSATLRCGGCGAVAGAEGRWPWACPKRREGDDIDHVLVPELDVAAMPLVTSDSDNPFVRYRTGMTPYHLWRGSGRNDHSFVALVEALDDKVAAVAGHGFRMTPLARFPALDDAIGARVWVKDETGNVAGSHKGRHLFGVLVLLQVLEKLGRGADGELVIASCGNAALAAAAVAAAGGRSLRAFVPPDADAWVLQQLAARGAAIEVCPRDGRLGDPCYRRFRGAAASGSVPFSCQGPDNGNAIEGASTLAWEVVEALPNGVARVVIQVGGGALASACIRGFGVWPASPVVDTVQTAGAHPLERAVGRLRQCADTIPPPPGGATPPDHAAGTIPPPPGGATPRDHAAGTTPPPPGGATPPDHAAPADRQAGIDVALAHAALHRSRYMWPWGTEPSSVARGILDDETYDWLAVARAMLETGGTPVVVDEALLMDANDLARAATGIDVDETASAGLAGLLHLARHGRIRAGSDVLVIFTGRRRAPRG